MREFEIIFYDKPDGSEPAKDFILNIKNKKLKAKILKEISMLQINGNELREPYSKFLEDGIFELRAKVSSDISRILYFFVLDNKIILTNGFIKKTQKTPREEIEKAKKYKKEYLSRKENEK